jgi:hypothetical protein
MRKNTNKVSKMPTSKRSTSQMSVFGIAVITAIVFSVALLLGCPEDVDDGDKTVVPVGPSGLSMAEAIPLTENVWANGNIPTSTDEQWFKFTATETSHYIHVGLGTLTNLYIQLYENDGSDESDDIVAVGTLSEITSSTTNNYINKTSLTVDNEYYIKVTTFYYYHGGTFKIGFNKSFVPPGVTTLEAGVWADGNIAIEGDEQWFKFTATADTHYIHFREISESYHGEGVYVNVYDSSGTEVGSKINIKYNITNTNRTTTANQEYYIKVTPVYTNESGTFKIAFSASVVTPGKAVAQLTADTWADGDIPTSTDEQWFKFTATADTHYIHFRHGPLLYGVFVNVYDSSGTEVGSGVHLTINTNLTTTADQEYYIRVMPYYSDNSGTFEIAFNTSFGPPGVTTLEAGVWADGNFLAPLENAQWFKFTATDTSHYIHFRGGTLWRVSVYVYDSSGTKVGDTIGFNSNGNAYRTTTANQEYYIMVTLTANYDSGTYEIAFNNSTTPPSTP